MPEPQTVDDPPHPGVGLSLDCSAEPWHGVFPGLGECWIDEDGAVRVEAVARDEEPQEQRADALRHGWGEPLSWLRRGHLMVSAWAAAPAAEGPCLLFTSHGPDATVMRNELATRGWRMVAESPTPLDVSGEAITVLPRPVPFLATRRRVVDHWDQQPVRADTDVVTVDWPRRTTAGPLGGIVQVRPGGVGIPNQAEVVGREKVPLVSRVIGHGVWSLHDTGDPAGLLMRDHALRFRMVGLPMLMVSLEHASPDAAPQVDAIEAWLGWSGQDTVGPS